MTRKQREMRAIGAAIKARRARAGLTQERLGGAVGVTRAYVALVESGRCEVTGTRLLMLSRALGLKAGRLLVDAERALDARKGAP